MRVLIIDDDHAHGESLADLLNSRGHEAYFAPSLSEATWLLDLFRFDIALLDFDMPDMTGAQAASSLEKRDSKLRSIVMSAREVDRERAALQLPPTTPVLPKPIRIGQLFDTMIGLVTGSSLVLRLSFPIEKYHERRRTSRLEP